MKFNTNKNKILKLSELLKKNEIDLSKKANKRDNREMPNYVFKAPKVISDTGWFNLNVLEENIIQEISPLPSTRVYGWLSQDGTYLSGQEIISTAYVWFNEVIDVPSHLLPFVNYSLMIKSNPDFEIFPQHKSWYNIPREADYFHIKSDGVEIYKGYDYDSNPYLVSNDPDIQQYEYIHDSYTLPAYFASIHDNDSDTDKFGTVNFVSEHKVIDDFGTQWISSTNPMGTSFTQGEVQNTEDRTIYGVKTMSQAEASGWGRLMENHYILIGSHPTDGQPVYFKDKHNEISYSEDISCSTERLTLGNAHQNNVNTNDYSWISLSDGDSAKFLHYRTTMKNFYNRVTPNEDFFYDGLNRGNIPQYVDGDSFPPYAPGDTKVVYFEKNKDVPDPVIPDDLTRAHIEDGDDNLGSHRTPHFSRVYQVDDADFNYDLALSSDEPKAQPGQHIMWTLDIFKIKASATKNISRNYTWQLDRYEGMDDYDTKEEERPVPYYVPNIDFQVRLIVTLEAPLYYHENQIFRDKE